MLSLLVCEMGRCQPLGVSWGSQESELVQHPLGSGQQQLIPAEGVVVASRREKWSRPRERMTAMGLRLQTFCLAV